MQLRLAGQITYEWRVATGAAQRTTSRACMPRRMWPGSEQ